MTVFPVDWEPAACPAISAIGFIGLRPGTYDKCWCCQTNPEGDGPTNLCGDCLHDLKAGQE